MIDQNEIILAPLVWCATGYIVGQSATITIRGMGNGRVYHWYAGVEDSIGCLDAQAGLELSIEDATEQAQQAIMRMMGLEVD